MRCAPLTSVTYDTRQAACHISKTTLAVIALMATVALTAMGVASWMSMHKVVHFSVAMGAGAIALVGSLASLALVLKTIEYLNINPFAPSSLTLESPEGSHTQETPD